MCHPDRPLVGATTYAPAPRRVARCRLPHPCSCFRTGHQQRPPAGREVGADGRDSSSARRLFPFYILLFPRPGGVDGEGGKGYLCLMLVPKGGRTSWLAGMQSDRPSTLHVVCSTANPLVIGHDCPRGPRERGDVTRFTTMLISVPCTILPRRRAPSCRRGWRARRGASDGYLQTHAHSAEVGRGTLM